MKYYTTLECYDCGCVFIMITEDIQYTDYLTCPLHGSHDNIHVTGRYDKINECMANLKYRKGLKR